MSSLSFGNLTTNTQQINPELEKRTQSQENFTAIDREKLKQDTVQLTKNAKEEAKENRIVKNIKGVFSKDTKKTLTTIALVAATIFGVGALGNSKLATEVMVDVGAKVDDVLANNKIYKSVAEFFSKTKNKIGDFFKKSKTVQDISNTFKINRAKPSMNLAQGMGQGFGMQFANTVLDAFRTAGAKNADAWDDILGKLVGTSNVDEINHALRHWTFKEGGQRLEAIEIANRIVKNISENFGCESKKDLTKIFKQIKKGHITGLDGKPVDIDLASLGFKNLKMNQEGILGNWLPAIGIEKIGRIFKKDFEFNRCNVGDTLLKYGVSTGKLADTKVGALLQGSLVVPGESISNFVCDSSTFNVLTLPAMFTLYNNIQDSPKEKRGATIADDFIGSLAHMLIAMPLAFKTTYGLATLGNLEGKTIASKPLKAIGKFFGMGLNPLKDGVPQIKQPKGILGKIFKKTKGAAGGTMRFALIMLVLSSAFAKPIRAAIHKVFGKPYDKEKEEQQKQLEAQKNQIIPELGITQGELMEKIQKNPNALAKLQTDPKLAQTVAQNPKAILDLLDGKEVQYIEPKPTPAQQGQLISPANKKIIGNNTNVISNNAVNKTVQPQEKVQTKETAQTQNVDTATYIPSSQFVAPQSSMSQEQTNEYNNVMTKADKVLAAAEKYI